MSSWRWAWRDEVVWPLVVVLLLGLGLFDNITGLFGYFHDSFTRLDSTTAGPLTLGSALLAVAGLLLWPRLGARSLPLTAGVVAVVSLGITVAVHVIAGIAPGLDEFSAVQDPFGFTEPAALSGLLILVTWRGTPVWSAVVAPVCVAAIVARPLAVRVDLGNLIAAFFLVLTSVGALAIGLTVRLVVADRQRRETAVRAEQRAEFARDLHDFVAHHVTGIVIQAQGARSIAVRRPDLVPPALERIEHAGAEALKSMRAMVGMLREADPQGTGKAPEVALSPLAGIAEVRVLVEEFAPVGGGRAALRTEGDFADLPMEVGTTVHRVVMEALTNIRKHARDFTEVEVAVVRTGDRITVTVTDDGRPRVGHQALHTLQSLGGGFGLKGLGERVGMIGGRVEAGPGPAGGWRIEATLPLGASVERTVGKAA